MKLLFMPERGVVFVCDWCGVRPNEQHGHDCPDRDDAHDFPAFCHRCGVYFLTTCGCDEEIDR